MAENQWHNTPGANARQQDMTLGITNTHKRLTPPYNATQQRNNTMYRDATHTQTPHNTDHNNTTRHNKTPQRTRHHKNAGKSRQITPHDITQRSYMAPQGSYVAQPTRQDHNTTQPRDTTHHNKPDNTEHNTTTDGKNNGAQDNVLYNATNRQTTTHNIEQRYLTPHTNVQPNAPKHNATTQHTTTQRTPRHITQQDETQHQNSPNATRENGHHETHNPIRARNDTRHNRATQRWAQHGVPTWNQHKT